MRLRPCAVITVEEARDHATLALIVPDLMPLDLGPLQIMGVESVWTVTVSSN